ncbi:MAG: hypothetical protein QOJ51_3109 [Acidobacteriaceae bacterium]|jgi:hypothetical protein|nr:hypothetical protein [Acidobacteriaceae bacterium]
MGIRKGLTASVLLLWCLMGAAKDKKKVLLPTDVLEARTILVIIDPDAGIAAEHPNANRMAREDVEKALMKWGRYSLVMEPSNADLIITVRKGSGKIAQPTIGGVPTNNDIGVIQPTDSGGRVGVRQGNPAIAGGPLNPQSTSAGPRPQVEAGESQDMFVVYRGNKENPAGSPLDFPAVWRYSATDALASPEVPAVDVFRDVISKSEKALNKTP